MNTLQYLRKSMFKPIACAVFFTFFLAACGGGGGGGGGTPIPTIEGTALIPGGSAIPKTGFSKALPGTGAFTNSKVRARSLSTGVSYDSTSTVGADGIFKIEGIPFGDDYLLMARKGSQVVSKFVTIPANALSPFPIGQIDLASTATVRRVERDVQDDFPNEDITFQPGVIPSYDNDIINAIWLANPDKLIEAFSALAEGAMADSGKINGTSDLNLIFKENGEINSEKLASINIYLTLYQVLIGGNPYEDESLPDVITNYINGGTGNVIADKIVINHVGDVTNITNIIITPEDFKDHLDAIFLTQTTITGGPANPTTETSATFDFVSNKLESTFECQLDGGLFENCASPKNDYPTFSFGTHTFCVKATGPDGVIDPTADCHPWRIDLPDVLINFAQDPPTAVTLPVGATTTTSAVLPSLINPEGTETRAYFEWGVDTNYGNTTALKEVGSGFNNIPISETLIGLSTVTAYHFRVVSVNLWGIALGNDQSFVTD